MHGWVYGRGMVPGRVYGWVYREGNTGVPYPVRCSRKEDPYQRSGPRKALQGPGVGGYGSGCVYLGTAAGTASGPPSGPGRCLAGPPCPEPLECRLLAYMARFDLNSWKLSQNHGVSPKSVEKACHSPCFPKRVQEVTSWNSQISIFRSLLSQGINGPFLTLCPSSMSK